MFDCGCEVEHIGIAFNNPTGHLYIAEGQTPHIHRTVRSFLAINPELKRIDIYVDGAPDTLLLYVDSVSEWRAVPPTPPFFGEIK